MVHAKRPRILVIDDDPAFLELVTALLHNEGYEVRTVRTAPTGEAACEAWRPDVVVAEVVWPLHRGVDVLRRFKALDDRVQVILLSGYGSVPTAVEAMKAGAYTFVEKPIESDRLLALIGGAVSARRPLQEPLPPASATSGRGFGASGQERPTALAAGAPPPQVNPAGGGVSGDERASPGSGQSVGARWRFWR